MRTILGMMMTVGALLANAQDVRAQAGQPDGTLELDCQLPVGRVITLGGRVATTCPGQVALTVPAGDRIPVVVALGRAVARKTEVVVPAGGRVRVQIVNQGGNPAVETVPTTADTAPFVLAALDTLTQDADMLAEAPGLPSPEERKRSGSSTRSWMVSLVGLGGVALMVTGLALILGGVTQTVLGAQPPPSAAGALPAEMGPLADALVFTGPTLIVLGVATGAAGLVVLVVGLLLGAKPF